MAKKSSTDRQGHWTATRNLNIVILILWFVFSIVVPFFAKELNSYSFLGFPLGYYMCVQGSLIAFAALIWIQNFRQDAIDNKFGVGE